MSYYNKVINRDYPEVGSVSVLEDYISGDNSHWNMHGLQLRSNRLYRHYQELRSLSPGYGRCPVSSGNMNRYMPIDWASLESKSYAKFRRKLYQGSASLGVTLGSYKQSREMIVSRYQQLNRRADVVLAHALTKGKKLKPKDVASIHLEVIFGWTPLLQDIHSAATTVIQQGEVKEWIKAVVREVQISNKLANWSDPWLPVKILNTLYCYHGRGAQVTVSNPNTWLAERAGLLNPAAVAWDLVPWSFVVNMFVNTGQLVNSITDFAGLGFSNGYEFRKWNGTHEWRVSRETEWPYRNGSQFLYWGRHREQTLNATAIPPVIFKIPQASWELAAMAASLFTQKFSKVAGLIKSSYRMRHHYTE